MQASQVRLLHLPTNYKYMKDLVDIFSDLPDERMDESGHDYAHDPLDDLEADCWERFTQDWERED